MCYSCLDQFLVLHYFCISSPQKIFLSLFQQWPQYCQATIFDNIWWSLLWKGPPFHVIAKYFSEAAPTEQTQSPNGSMNPQKINLRNLHVIGRWSIDLSSVLHKAVVKEAFFWVTPLFLRASIAPFLPAHNRKKLSPLESLCCTTMDKKRAMIFCGTHLRRNGCHWKMDHRILFPNSWIWRNMANVKIVKDGQ